ncbi:MAG TPA: amidohydrolase family protein [Bradyrhizobium sp.]|nr:amidohydrolase family protein [Bradyrhizobium sp.]
MTDTKVIDRTTAPNRRRFLQGVGAVTILGALPASGAAQEAIPNSAGTAPPKLKAPANACDCHMHAFDPARFPPPHPARVQPNATIADYRLLQKRLGLTRTVIVTPAAYVTENAVTLDAIAQLKPNARGVAVVHPDITDAELKMLDAGGVRGIRFTQNDPAAATTTIDMIEPLSKRVAVLGWHLQIHMRGDQIAAARDLWDRLPSAIVFDHMGRLQSAGVEDPAFAVMRRLIDKGRTWVKISGAYIETKVGPPTYADATKVAEAFVRAAPERMLWGSDWPHPSLDAAHKPDDALLFDLLAEWAPDEKIRHRILVENPEAVYGFAKSG